MADVQVENGYIRIANELVDAANLLLDDAELRVFNMFVRLTYGWNQKSVSITLRELAILIRKTERQTTAICNRLVNNNVITRETNRPNPTKWSIQKNYDKWLILKPTSGSPLQEICGKNGLILKPTSGSPLQVNPEAHFRIENHVLKDSTNTITTTTVRNVDSSGLVVFSSFDLVRAFYDRRGIDAKPTPRDIRIADEIVNKPNFDSALAIEAIDRAVSSAAPGTTPSFFADIKQAIIDAMPSPVAETDVPAITVIDGGAKFTDEQLDVIRHYETEMRHNCPDYEKVAGWVCTYGKDAVISAISIAGCKTNLGNPLAFIINTITNIKAQEKSQVARPQLAISNNFREFVWGGDSYFLDKRMAQYVDNQCDSDMITKELDKYAAQYPERFKQAVRK